MSEWEIPVSALSCAGCGKGFSAGEGHYSFLYEEPKGFRRLDYCQTCRAGAKEPFFSFWKTTRAEEEKKPLVADDVLLNFFLRLVETEEKKDFLYVLALALERRRVLKRIGQGKEILELELAKDKRRFQISMPQLGEEAISTLTEEVGRLLEGSLTESEGSL
ncbi:MAG: hypothetical protein AMS15_01575 [Planctomycetes bacterium DG_23]|nr:MAG: hypothetical protein AMS15_01575 [Planctomycetes bacterium DG_23]